MRFLPFAAVLAGVLANGAALTAQTATSGSIRPVVFEKANADRDLQHGRLVRISMNGSEQPIEATVVRSDAKNVYVRTEPGAPPRALARKDIKSVEKGMQGVVTKDGIRLAATATEVRNDEIQPIEIVNGTRRSVTYLAPTLSPGERSALISLQTAENEVARLEALAVRDTAVLDNTLAIQSAQRRIQELLWLQLARQPSFIPYDYDITVYGPVWGWGMGNRTFGWGGYPAALPSVTVPPAVVTPPVITPTTVDTPKALVAPEALTKARQDLAMAQGRAIFEQGHLVAIVVDDNK